MKAATVLMSQNNPLPTLLTALLGLMPLASLAAEESGSVTVGNPADAAQLPAALLIIA
jgi:hypothetical protein